MAFNPRKFLSTHRNKVMPALLSASLLGGVIATISMSTNATADYVVGCSDGYGSTGTTFGLGSGYGYGYLNGGGPLTYGYGNQVCPISVATSTLAAGTVGSFYSQTLSTLDVVATPVQWVMALGTTLPSGLSLSSSGVISGMPLASGTTSFAVAFTDNNGEHSAPKSLSIAIAAAVTTTTPPPATTTTVPATTTTLPATTTTLPATTTTTTVASPQAPVFQTISGRPAYVGETRLFVVHGLRLSGLTVSSNGAVLRIVSDSATLLKVDVTPIYGRKAGGYPLTGRNAYGSTSFRYSLLYKFAPVVKKILGRPAYIGQTTLFTVGGFRLGGVKVTSNGGPVKMVRDLPGQLKFDITPVVGWRPGPYTITISDKFGWATFRYSQIKK